MDDATKKYSGLGNVSDGAGEKAVPPPEDPAQFYRAHVFCCTNRRVAGHPRGCCAEKDAEPLRDYLKKQAAARGLKGVRVNSAGCLDRCELGPTLVIYPEGVWYTYRDKADLDEILETHLIGGGRVARLMLMPDQRLPAKA